MGAKLFNAKIVVASVCGTCPLKVGILLFLESGSKSGAGLDDSSNSSEDPVSSAPPAPRVQSVGRGVAKSESDVHVHVR